MFSRKIGKIIDCFIFSKCGGKKVTFSIEEDLEYICKLIFDSYKIPISFINHKKDLEFELSHINQDNPLHPSKGEFLGQLFFEDAPCQFPVLKTTVYLENFFSISIHSGEQFRGNIIVGPVLHSRLSEESIKGILNDLQIKNNDEIAQYYQSIPILSSLNFINISMVLYYMLYQKKLDLVEILQNKEKFEIEQPDVIISERRQNTRTHTDPLAGKKLLECIKEGKIDEVIKNLRAINETGDPGVLSKTSHLRSQKNLAIAAITHANTAAQEGGLFPEIAFTLSDLFIQNLEEINESKAIIPFIENAFLEFTKRVEKNRKYRYSRPISACQNYIFTHLYEDITLNHLAEVAGMNPSYLSVLFKKEVGHSLREYIQLSKVEEAKNLMTFTNHSLTEISSLLNFYDQSHFTKIFKKFAGVTPKQFKNGTAK